MDTDTRTQPQATQVAPEAQSRFGALHSLVTEFITGGRPDPDNPQPPGPWDPVIRQTLTRIRDRLGPHPDPWKVMSSVSDLSDMVSLNPQPLPPKALFSIMLAEEVINHVSRLQEITDIAGQSRSPARDYMARFIDDIELCPPYRKWPFPPPKRGETLFDPVDIVTMGVAFTHLAETVPDERLRGDIQGMGARLMEKGTARM
jgi:hypothetical protein